MSKRKKTVKKNSPSAKASSAKKPSEDVLVNNLLTRAGHEIKFDQDLILLTVFSSMIAVFGLKSNNIYLIIASMLVSPLFDPMISTIIFLTFRKWRDFVRALVTLVASIGIAFFTSSVMWIFLNVETQDIATRGFAVADTFWVALIIGIVGAFLWIWPKTSNTSAGIAVAISLVPPIALSSLYFVHDCLCCSLNSLSELFINVAGILIGGTIIMYLHKLGKLP